MISSIGARVDVVAAADHEILGATGDPEIAVLIEAAEIAGVDPVPVNERALVVGVVEIAAEHAGAGHDARRRSRPARNHASRLTVGVELDDADAAVGQGRPTEPSRIGRSGISNGVDARGLGHAVDFDNRELELVLDRVADRNRNGRSAAGRISQAGDVSIAWRDRERCGQNRRHARQRFGLEAFDKAPDVLHSSRIAPSGRRQHDQAAAGGTALLSACVSEPPT